MTQQQPNKQNILITGASGGLGTALVHRLDDLNYRVFAGVRREEDGQALARSADDVVPVILDITDEASISAAAETVEQAVGSGGLHGLINNAGIIVQGPLELVSVASLRQQFEVNVVGQVAVTQAFLPALRIARGCVVNIGGAAGSVALPFLGPFSASKAALESLTDALRMELTPFDIDVTLIEPSALQTEIFDKAARRTQEDRDAAPPDVRALYTPAVAAANEALADQQATPVDVAVNEVVSALTDRTPETRYRVGHDARLLVLLRYLPNRWRDRLLMRTMGLTDEVFQQPDGSSDDN